MTNEEMQKMMEFILQQQVTFTVNIERLNEAQQRTEKNLAELAAAQAQMARQQTHMNDVVAAIADAQQRTEARVAELTEAQSRTDQKLAETDERLNVLIGVVERYFNNGRKSDS